MQAHLQPEILKMEPNMITNLNTKRYQGSFFQIPCKAKSLPLFLGVTHSGYQFKG